MIPGATGQDERFMTPFSVEQARHAARRPNDFRSDTIMHRVSKLAAGLTILYGLGGTAAMTQARAQAQPLPNDIQVRLAGAASVGQRLTREVAKAWAVKLGLKNVRVNAGVEPDEYEVVADRAESLRKMRISVSSKGMGAGLEPLLRGQTDFWMGVRQARESDLENVRKRNVPNVPSLQQFQAPGVENLVGLDPLAFLVNTRNPVKTLSYQQLRDLYSGKITNWSQLGGANLPVGLYVLDPSNAITGNFCDAVLGMPEVPRCLDSMARLAAPRLPVFEDMADAVASTPGGLGYLAVAERKNARAVAIGTDCGTGIDATPFRVKADEYPLIGRLYLYTNPARPLSPAARAYLDFILSNEGQAAVAKSGYGDLVPGLSPEAYSADRMDHVRDAQDGGHTRIRPNDARSFEEAVGSADRLSITFRFQAGTNDLDSRGEADVVRLVQLMQQPAYTTKQVVLVGYSGASGDYAEGRALSQDRAEAIRERLAAQSGLKDVVSLGVGPAAAVACNLDPNTAPLNQRVEVWLRQRT